MAEETKTKVAKPTIASVSKQLGDLVGSVTTLAESVGKISERVGDLEAKPTVAAGLPLPAAPSLNAPAGTKMEFTSDSGLKNGDGSAKKPTFTNTVIESKLIDVPVPPDYLAVKNEVFGPASEKFGVIMKGYSDQPKFLFTIIVPREYSDMSPADWDIKKADERSLAIPYAIGINGVREWCELVLHQINSKRRTAPPTPRHVPLS